MAEDRLSKVAWKADVIIRFYSFIHRWRTSGPFFRSSNKNPHPGSLFQRAPENCGKGNLLVLCRDVFGSCKINRQDDCHNHYCPTTSVCNDPLFPVARSERQVVADHWSAFSVISVCQLVSHYDAGRRLVAVYYSQRASF